MPEEEDCWIEVSSLTQQRGRSVSLGGVSKKDMTTEDTPKKLTKQQVKNKRRSERRKQKEVNIKNPQVFFWSSSDSDDDNCSSEEEREQYAELSRRLRRLRKTLKQIQNTREKAKDRKQIEADVEAKLAREPQVQDELDTTTTSLALVEEAREARLVARRAVSALIAKAREAEAQLILSVEFDERYACPICTEIVEVAVYVPRACSHAFCRACLEDHVAKATKASDCLCPLCRQSLCEPISHRVEARPAPARFRMKHVSGRCHCGLELPLYRMRHHLRTCGPKASLFPPRRKFGHEFKQPSFALSSSSTSNHKSSSSSSPRIQQQQRQQESFYDQQEQLQLQAAILASMADSPSSSFCEHSPLSLRTAPDGTSRHLSSSL